MSVYVSLDKKQTQAVKRMLAQLPKKIRNKIFRQELRKSAKKLVAPSKAATPTRTGKLKKSVKVRASNKKGSIGIRVGYGEKSFTGETFYGSFLEFGWRVGKRPSKNVAGTDSDKRTKVPGKRMLGKVAEKEGPALLDAAVASIAKRVIEEARNA